MIDVKLTGLTRFSGCGAKLGPALLDKALCGLSQPHYPELLLDFSTTDDAGIYQINDTTALVQTVDFFPPIVDDSFTFGQIAAANALSDIYAMGARPVTALSIVGFPADKVDISVLRAITEGALDKLKEAETPLVGGHSVNDDELKFGLAVTGLVHPDKVLRNNQPKPGDALILTKPIGTGCINTALKAGAATEASIQAATESMVTLNRRAADILTSFPVHACTDVTGFGLLGHACEMLVGSGTRFIIDAAGLILLPEVERYIAEGHVPAGTLRNRMFRIQCIENSEQHGDELYNLLFDPQTSGGLLFALPEADAHSVIERMRDAGVSAFRCGTVESGGDTIQIIPRT